MRLHEKLTALRKRAGLSQTDLAEQVDTIRQAVSKWETGAAAPSMENLRTLCRIYQVTMDQLTDDGQDLAEPEDQSQPEEGPAERAEERKPGQPPRTEKGMGRRIAGLLGALILGAASGSLLTWYAMDRAEPTGEPAVRLSAASYDTVYGDQGWTAEGAAEQLCEGVRTSLPQFEDCFPDLDRKDVSGYVQTFHSRSAADNRTIGAVSAPTGGVGVQTVVDLPAAGEDPYVFYSFTGDGSIVHIYAKSCPDQGYDLTVYDQMMGEDVAYLPDLGPGKSGGGLLTTQQGHRYDLRVNSTGGSGHGKMIVEAWEAAAE